jgi:hypothetical protein
MRMFPLSLCVFSILGLNLLFSVYRYVHGASKFGLQVGVEWLPFAAANTPFPVNLALTIVHPELFSGN